MQHEDIITQLCRPLAPIATGLEPHYPHTPGIRAVIFDVYGTLFISGTGDVGTAELRAQEHGVFIRQALEAAGLPLQGEISDVQLHQLYTSKIRLEQETVREQMGIQHPEVEIRSVWRQVLETLRELGHVSGEWSGDLISRLALEFEFRANPAWPMYHALGAIEMLKGEVKLGIISNAQFFTPLMFKALMGKSHSALGFERDLCYWSFERSEAKPSVRLFQRVAEKLDESIVPITPQETLYVGNDMLNDMWAADQAGMRTALFAGDARSLRLREDDPRVSGLQVDFIITDLYQIVELLGFTIMD